MESSQALRARKRTALASTGSNHIYNTLSEVSRNSRLSAVTLLCVGCFGWGAALKHGYHCGLANFGIRNITNFLSFVVLDTRSVVAT